MTDYDSPWKEALDVYFESFVLLCFPELGAAIDWSVAPIMLDKELLQIAPQSEVGSRTVDKLVEVKLLSGEVGWLLVHLEVQSQRDMDFARRMFVYFYRIRDKHDKHVVSSSNTNRSIACLTLLQSNGWPPKRALKKASKKASKKAC